TATANWAGSGASELLLNLDSALVPATATATAPTVTSVSTGFAYTLAGQLADGTRTLTISSLALSQGQSLVIDAPTHTAWLTDSVGIIANSQVTARAAITVDSPDVDWLRCEPASTSTITWTETAMDAAGMTITASASDAWR
ncbi:MAG TPA: hypothetical protein VMU89_09285, partial [Thermomicrobiaceae bacterium]|nr:hypothetical protein [Thermomicrobiaceae bacterium]